MIRSPNIGYIVFTHFLSVLCTIVDFWYMLHSFRASLSCITETLCSQMCNYPFSFLSSPWQPFHSHSMNLTILDISYMWNQASFVFLWLANSTQHTVFWVHLCWYILWMYFFKAVEYFIICTYHISFIHFPLLDTLVVFTS